MKTQTLSLTKVFAGKFADDAATAAVRIIVEQACRGWNESEQVRAADLRLSADDSKALTSSSFTAQTFVKGVAHRLALFAHGQTIERVQEGLTAQAQYALVAAAAPIKRGAGLTVSQLRDCLTVGMAKLLALPVKEAAAKVQRRALAATDAATDAATEAATATATDAATDAATEAATATATDAATDANEAAAHKRSDMTMRRIAALHEQAGILADAAKHEQQQQRVAAAAAAAAAAPAVAARTIHDAAIEFCRLADLLGVKLTKAQLSALDKAEKVAIPA